MRNLLHIFVFAITLIATFNAKASDVVILGDDRRVELLQLCGSDCQASKLSFATPALGANALEVANSAQRARHAIVVVDAASGPLQITREHILIARQAGVPSLSIMFVNMSSLEGMKDAPELIELEELEVRELMNKYEMGGDKAMVFHDFSSRSTKKLYSNGVGIAAVIEKTSSLPDRKINKLDSFTGKKFFAYLYLLTIQESKSVIPLKTGSSIGLWINGQSVSANVRSKVQLEPGDNSELIFEVEHPISAQVGSKFLLERGGKIIAAGVLTHGS
jgi:translation elongation factor EF-Tu-like GTPase